MICVLSFGCREYRGSSRLARTDTIRGHPVGCPWLHPPPSSASPGCARASKPLGATAGSRPCGQSRSARAGSVPRTEGRMRDIAGKSTDPLTNNGVHVTWYPPELHHPEYSQNSPVTAASGSWTRCSARCLTRELETPCCLPVTGPAGLQDWPPRLHHPATPAASQNRWSWNTPSHAFREWKYRSRVDETNQ